MAARLSWWIEVLDRMQPFLLSSETKLIDGDPLLSADWEQHEVGFAHLALVRASRAYS